ncbi:MAG: cytochrome c [Thermodesulfobacteriota bacterium]
MNYLVLVPIIAVMAALRFTKINILAWLTAWWIAVYLTLNYGIVPPVPSSVVRMFMGIVTLSLLAYLSADSQRLESAKGSVISFLADKKYTLSLIIAVVALPALVAAKVYVDSFKHIQAPISGRTIHPPPPEEIAFNGEKIVLNTALNPYRDLEESDPGGFRSHVKNGRRVYYQNCVFCHGDTLEGNGNFAHGFNPIPANFADPTTIAMLQESYLFWRIAKGAPGLPEESSPWDSAMPTWENFLTEEEIWDVILFLYDFTGQRPRALEIVE